jgi:murein DD-endopeptidase MepM/ murein hydrolase activator NlpD
MPTNHTLPWILGGGAAAAALYYWHRERGASKPSPDRDNADSSRSSMGPGTAPSKGAGSGSSGSATRPEPLPGRWVWPVGVWNKRKPEITDGFYGSRRDPRSKLSVQHGGVDIMYRRQPGDPWRAGTPNGTKLFVMPDHRAALAASGGTVWSAANTPRGWTVVIDHHPRKLATYYTHLSKLLVTPKQQVSAGTPIGIIGADPLDHQGIQHLHFEVWRGGSKDRFDPQRIIETTWEHVPDPGDLPHPLVARNGGHRPRDHSHYSVPVITHDRRPTQR